LVSTRSPTRTVPSASWMRLRPKTDPSSDIR
jgi:hypothetical protein